MAFTKRQTFATDFHGVPVEVAVNAYVRIASIQLIRDTAEVTLAVYSSEQAYRDGAEPVESLPIAFGSEATAATEPVLDPETDEVVRAGRPALPSLAELLSEHKRIAKALDTVRAELYPVLLDYLPELDGAKRA